MEKFVVAYIGFGNSVCNYHLPYVEVRKDKIKVKYIFELEEKRDSEKDSWYPDITVTSNIDDIMNDDEINLVVVNTPDEFHTYYTKMAIAHHKNVLCEKPFAMTAKEAREVYELGKKEGVVVCTNQNRRWDADMKTVRKVIHSGLIGDVVEFESHYDYFRPQIADRKGFGMLYGLGVHPIDQVIGEFGKPNKVVYDCRSIANPGLSDDYYDIDFMYDGFKAIVKTSFYVLLDYPRFIVHGTKGSFLMPALGHNSSKPKVPGAVHASFEQLPEDKWGTLSYIDDKGEQITQKIPTEVCDYGELYDNLYEVVFNNGEKRVKDEEVITVLEIIEEATKVAKNYK